MTKLSKTMDEHVRWFCEHFRKKPCERPDRESTCKICSEFDFDWSMECARTSIALKRAGY